MDDHCIRCEGARAAVAIRARGSIGGGSRHHGRDGRPPGEGRLGRERALDHRPSGQAGGADRSRKLALRARARGSRRISPTVARGHGAEKAAGRQPNCSKAYKAPSPLCHEPAAQSSHDHVVHHDGDDHADARQHHRKRRLAAHARNPVGLPGSDRVGADRLHRGRGHRHSSHRLVRRSLRPEKHISGIDQRLYLGLGAVRHVEFPGRDRRGAPAAGNIRRGPGAAVASGLDGHQSQGEAGLSHGHLGHGGHGRSDSRAHPGRLADRRLQLALGIFHQRSDRLPGHLRRLAIHPPGARGETAEFRRVRICHLELGRRRAADAARSRPTERLVLVDGNLDRGHRSGRDEHLLRRAYPDDAGRQGLRRLSAVQEPELRHRRLVHLHRRLGPVRDARAHPDHARILLDYPVATTGLVTAPSGVGTMIAMLIVGRLIGKVDLRLMLLVGFAVTAFSLWQMAHYSLDLSAGRHRLAGRDSGNRHGIGVRAPERGDVCHLEPGDARAGHRPLQPGAQYRQQHRHLAGADLVGAQYRHCACLAD